MTQFSTWFSNSSLLIIIFLILQISCSPKISETPSEKTPTPHNVTTDWNTFSATGEGFSLKYPKNWTILENMNGARVMFIAPENPEGFNNNFNLMLQDISIVNISTLDQFDEISKTQMKTIFGEKNNMTIKRIQFKGQETSVYEYSGDFNHTGTILHWKQYVFIKNNLAYVMTYTDSENNYSLSFPTAKKIFDSLELHDK